jgi:hypothetical protein
MKLTTKQARELGIDEKLLPKRQRRKTGKPEINRALVNAYCQEIGLPDPIYELQFAPPRQWKFDLCWGYRIALEVEGGSWIQGRHTRGKGFEDDLEKYNEATLRGWRLLRCTPGQLESGEALQMVKRAMETLR